MKGGEAGVRAVKRVARGGAEVIATKSVVMRLNWRTETAHERAILGLRGQKKQRRRKKQQCR